MGAEKESCKIQLCHGAAYKRGLCNSHYIRLRRYGRYGLKQRLGALNPLLAPTEIPTLLDLAWAAGIYEGEGSCAWNGRSEQVTVPQKGDWLPLRLKILFGGSIRPHSNSTISVWAIHGARARGFLMTIYGLLSPRRQEQVRRALRVGEFA